MLTEQKLPKTESRLPYEYESDPDIGLSVVKESRSLTILKTRSFYRLFEVIIKHV